jgi:uncharacterized membrane protein YvbJ
MYIIMICPKCKSQIPDDARECHRCHAPMKFDQPLDFSARKEHTIEHKEKISAPSDGVKNLMFIMIIVLLLAIVLLVYYNWANTTAGDAAAAVLPVVRLLSF